MSIRSKLTKLESRLDAERCPHCGWVLSLCQRDDDARAHYTPEERVAIMTAVFQRGLLGREELLAIVAAVAPERRLEIADDYPLGPGEVLGIDEGNTS